MKVKRFLAVLLVLVLVLAGCSEAIDDSAIRADAVLLLEGFLANDYDACRAVLNESVSDGDLEGIFSPIHDALAQLGTYEMTAVNWKRQVSGDRDVTAIQYLVAGEGGKYYLSVSKVAGQEGLAGFQIEQAGTDAEATTPIGPVHWVFTAVGMAVLGFVIWMMVDCFRRKMKFKWLWMPLMLLGMMILTFTMQDGGFTFRFNVGLYLGITELVTFAAGGFRAKLYVPVVAIVYFLKRKQLTIGEEKPEIVDAAQ